jgi:hypothetical protein
MDDELKGVMLTGRKRSWETPNEKIKIEKQEFDYRKRQRRARDG